MKTRIQIKHLFDLGLNKPLAKDVLDLLIAEGRASSLLARSLSAYLNNSDMVPLTDYELFRACNIYLSDCNVSNIDIIYYAANGRFEIDEQKEAELFLERLADGERICLDIDRTIEILKQSLRRFEYENAPVPKGHNYDDVKLENVKKDMGKKMLSFIEGKDRYLKQIQYYKDLKIRIITNKKQILKKLDDMQLEKISDIKQNFKQIKKELNK